MKRIGIIGAGIMGSAYARNLLAAGFDVVGFDTEESRRANLEDLGAVAVLSPQEVASNVDVVFTALPTVAALDDVSSDVAASERGGLIVVEMSTFPIDAKMRARETLAEVDIELIDAPVSGTGLQAASAEIVVYASGDSGTIERLDPIFEAVSKQTFDLGEFGNGSRMKFIANLLVSVHNLATAEAFLLGMEGGLDPKQILEVISAGVGTSKIFEIRGPLIAEGDFAPSAKLRMFIKDIDVIAGFAEDVGVPTPLLDASRPWYEEATAGGLGDLDAAALFKLLQAKSGTDR